MNIYPSEHILDDDYPVHYGYWYLADGEPRQCEILGDPPATVFELRIRWNAGQIRRCDLKARGMLDQTT